MRPLRDEERPILGRSPSSSSSAARRTNSSRAMTAATHQRLGRGIVWNRILILLVAVATCVAGWYFQTVRLMDVQGQLNAQRETIQQMQRTINIHEQVIQRFNSSITNTDVMNHLNALQFSFERTEQQLHDELAHTQAQITQQLQQTVQELSTTVNQAEQEISQEVDKVKKDVEHYVITTQDQFSMENSFMVYQLAGTFTLLSCLISMWHMTAHLRKMNQPDVQRRILAILWMSPVYAVTSWFSLVFPSAEGYLAILKDGYEAYIIYQFLSFCIAVLGKGDRNKVVDLLAHHADHLTPPFRLFGFCEYLCCGDCCRPDPYENNRALADAILLQCQLFAMQFVLFRPLTTTAMVVLGKLKYYGNGEGPMDYRAPQFYITIIQNLSIFIAFTGLLKFYHAVDKELAWCRPFAKFLCIKGVVFMTFWQGLAISVLAQTTDVGGKDEQEWAKSAQNFLICLEMLLFSIAHFHCFPTEEWQEGYRVKHQQSKFGDSMALGDFFSDVKLILQNKPARKKKKRHSPKSSSRKKLDVVLEAPSGEENETSDEGENNRTDKNKNIHDDDNNNHDNHQAHGVFRATNSSGTLSTDSEEAANHSQYASESSFDDSQTQEYDDDDTSSPRDEDDEDGDEEKGFLARHYANMSEEDRFVARALEKSLGMAGDDPDIAEATRRLLESKILSPDFFKDDTDEGDEHAYRLYGAATSSFDDDVEIGAASSDDDLRHNYDEIGSVESLDDTPADVDDVVAESEGGFVTPPQAPDDIETAFTNDTSNTPDEKVPPETTQDVLPPEPPRIPVSAAITEPHIAAAIANVVDTPVKETDQAEEKQSTRTVEGTVSEATTTAVDTSQPEITEAPIPDGFKTSGHDSRNDSEGIFWAFDGNDAITPTRSSAEPAPLPTANESTPLLSRKSSSGGSSTGEKSATTPLHPSIFTTVAALVEESDDNNDDDNGDDDKHKKEKESPSKK